MERVKSNSKLKQVSRFVIVKRPYHHIISKLYFKDCDEEKFIKCHINLYNYFEGSGLDRNAVENIILTNNAINSFLKFLVSSNTFFECKNVDTNSIIIAEKIRGNKLYIIQKNENQDWTNDIELETKKEIESLRKKLEIIVKKIYNIDFDKDKYEVNNIQINSTNSLLNFKTIINEYLYEQILKEKSLKDYDKWTDLYQKFGFICEIKKPNN